MRLKVTIICNAFLLWAVAAVGGDKPWRQGGLPSYIGVYYLDKEIRQTANSLSKTELRIAYLSGVIASNSQDSSKGENYRKSSAIRLLGVVGGTNAIPLLVSNVAFVDAKYPERPVMDAMQSIGETGVPYLPDALKDPSATAGENVNVWWKRFTPSKKLRRMWASG